ncbi:LysM peptidoglycan-binding domain-containing protein [Glutamicibacter uratoxydans]|uniref:LysM peptidoglycan-binding domain-containing protein n=1 Tax=Glutamicibacter uratoxydans TaxID=43667 RepID=UPI003D6E8038
MPQVSNRVTKSALGAAASAAIPAVVLGSLAAAPAQAAPVELPSTSLLVPKGVSVESVKIAEEHIKANLLASRIPTLGFPAQQQLQEIEVTSGASLWSIAREHDTTVAELKKINDLSGDLIRVGQKLKVPSGSSSAKTTTKVSQNAKGSGTHSSYTVRAGDTMGHIAMRLGVSLNEVRKAAGNPSADRIIVGQTLNFGGSNAQAESKPQTSTNTKGSGTHSSYTVRAGDTMGHIAMRLGVSLNEVRKAAGNPSADRIIVGQTLNFGGSNAQAESKPQTSQNTRGSGELTSYTVKSGDTLGAIAARHGMSLSTLMSLNNLNGKSLIYPGNKLKLSGQAAPKSEAKPKQESSSGSYTVKAGDTLGGIAAAHGISLSRLLDLNPQISVHTPLQINTKLSISGSSIAPNSTQKSQPQSDQKIGNTFLGRTYPDATVRNANENKDYLDSISVPSKGEMQALIRSTAQSMGVDPALALAHAHQESGFNQRAVSPANAIGTMQVIPSTGEWMSTRVGRKLNLLDPKDNVVAGIATIKYNIDNAANLDQAIAAYYQGLGGVRKYGMYSDTKTYVASVKAHMKLYR